MTTFEEAKQEGRDARNSDNPEPKIQYEPGSELYRAFAEGFLENIEKVDVSRYD